MVSAYLEGEDVFKEVCRQYCDQLLPQQNTLALILPLILGNSKTSLQDMNLQGWSRMLSGLLAIVPKEAATALITELGASLQAQHRIIPAQICAILCGRELQSFTANPAFSLLGGEVVEEGPSGSNEDQEGALVACIAASEIYEYGLSLSNGMYRSRSLASVKLLHALHCEEKGLVEQARGYVEELNGFVKNYRVNNVSFQNQLELLRQRLGTEGDKDEDNSIIGHLLSAVDKGINSIMAKVEGEMSPQSVETSQPETPVAPIQTMGQTVSQGQPTPLGQQTPPLIQAPAIGQQQVPTQPAVEQQPELVTLRPTPAQRRSHRADSHKRPFIPFIPTTPLSEINPETRNSIPTPEAEKPVIEETPIRNDSPVVSEDPPRHVMFAAPIPMKTEPVMAQAPTPAPVAQETPFESYPVQTQPKPTPSQPKQTPKPATTPTEVPKKEERSTWSLFGSLFGRSESGKKVYKVELPKEEVKPYYDEMKKKWIIPGVEEEEEAAPLPPPPPMVSAPVQPPESKLVDSNPITAVKPIEPSRPPVQPLMPVPVAYEREENEQSQSDQVQPNQLPLSDQLPPSNQLPLSDQLPPSNQLPPSDQSQSSQTDQTQFLPHDQSQSSTQPRRQNKRVAKSKSKSRPMALYANPFSCVYTNKDNTTLHS